MAGAAVYTVLGLGLFGTAIARTLAGLGHHVLAVDREAGPVEALGPHVAEAVEADATDRSTLEALRVRRSRAVFNTIGDLTPSILCTLALRELGVRPVFAKVNSPQQGRILSRLGAQEILFPERDMGERVARRVATGSTGITTEIDLARDASILEIAAPKALVGRTLAEAGVRARWGITVVAVRRRRGDGAGPGEVVVSPPADLRIDEQDLVLVAGKNDDLRRLLDAEE